ncbi:MAG TPA: orotidine-5'-phosphate decarboxylase [Terriglobales bacterium]|nr:orotidine-5'-phosphate decarboxylase [Terriglobales bacterium]
MPEGTCVRPLAAAAERLIVALDVATASEAKRLVQAIGPGPGYKIGKQLFVAEGPGLVRELTGSGRRVFLDLKFHDIPNTVAGAVRSAAELGVSMLTVHACGGRRMLEAAVEAAGKAGSPPLVLAVTVLTSLGEADLGEIGVPVGLTEQVIRLARLAQQAGCGGVVASPRETAELRRELGAEMVLVTPGVRPAGSASGDQARTATPGEAIRAGADYIVVGRPITGAPDPGEAARAVVVEITRAAEGRSLVVPA